MSTIEDRLSAALSARADLVQPEDLRPAGPPTGQQGSRLRTPATYLLAAAACGAAVALPFIVGGDGSDQPAPPPATQTPELEPPAEVEGAGWPKVSASDRYDVDGDGERDRVVTRTESGKDVTQEPWRLEAQLSSGGTYAVLLPGDGWGINPIGPVDLDGDGADEILYYNGLEDDEIGVVDLVGPVLSDVEVPGEPGISSAHDEEGRVRAWWREQGGLWSVRSLEGGFVPGDHTGPGLPAVYPVDVWRWVLADGRLVAEDQGRQCVEAGYEMAPYACDVESVAALPAFYPAAEEVVGLGKQAQTTWDQALVTIELVGEPGEVSGEGDVELQVAVDGEATSAPVPAGPEPVVFTTLLAADVPAVVVRQGEADPSYTVFAVRDGQLEVLQPAPGSVASLRGGELSAAGTAYETWLTMRGELFTRSAVEDGSDSGYDVALWTLGQPGELVAERVATATGESRICFDLDADPVLWSLC